MPDVKTSGGPRRRFGRYHEEVPGGVVRRGPVTLRLQGRGGVWQQGDERAGRGLPQSRPGLGSDPAVSLPRNRRAPR
eukprot:7774545-Pyramimonas_sp.AAC.1